MRRDYCLSGGCGTTLNSESSSQPSAEGEVRTEGTDVRDVVEQDKINGISIGDKFVPLAEMTQLDTSSTSRYDWPLEVGKTWRYEESWTSTI